MTSDILLRDVIEADLPIFFEQQQDPVANQRVAFTARDPADREAFMRHWARILGDERVTIKTILFQGQVAGNVLSFEQSDEREVGYWLGTEYWGKGIATTALSEFLGLDKTRPLYAHAAKDNLASIRVLEKCGFTIVGCDKGYAHARGEEIEEVVLKLEHGEPNPPLLNRASTTPL